MKKNDAICIGTMLAIVLMLIGEMFGWVWQIVLPFYALFIVPTLTFEIVESVKKCKKN